MPKKTKKQKILAILHRQSQISNTLKTSGLSSNTEFVKSQNEKSNYGQTLTYSTPVSLVTQAVIKTKSPEVDYSYGYVKKDLIKITIFSIFALLLQGMLYFLLRTR
ncbi:hypothetical protein HY029_02500 [Candidatus Gottesmanbacteria bacterium]|nr:hypothetical protein [Candidatus Gottesmanbacteria bacterium]